jgi:hypothetical protein
VKEPSPHNLVIRYPLLLAAAIFAVFFVALLTIPSVGGQVGVAVILAAAASLSGLGTLLAWAHRPWFLYLTLVIMTPIPLEWLGVLSPIWIPFRKFYIDLLSLLPFVFPLWGFAVHLQYAVNKRRQKGGRE